VIRACILMGFVSLSAFPRLDADGSVRLPSKEQDTVSTQRQSGRDPSKPQGTMQRPQPG